MVLFGRNSTTVGLDIGSGLVKVAVIDHAGEQPELVKIAIVPLLPDAIVEGEVMDPPLVADAIRQALESTGITPKLLVTAVSGRDVIIKRIQTERVKEQQAYEIIRLEAEQHVPDADAVEIDFQILDSENFDDEMSVLFVAAKRDLVDAKVRILSEAGVEPSIVDVEAFALHNAFEFNHPDAMNGSVALVNVGNEITNVNLLDNGVPILTRDLPTGTRRFREDLQRDHGLSADDADSLVRGTQRTTELDRVLQLRGEEIATGIERAATFLSASGKTAADVKTVYICGGGAATPGLADVLGKRLKCQVQQANSLANLYIRDDALNGFSADDIAPLLMVPIGLALRKHKP